MATFFWRGSIGLSFLAFLLFSVSFFVPTDARASVSQSQAFSNCQTGWSYDVANSSLAASKNATCQFVASYGTYGAFEAVGSGVSIPCNGFSSYGPTPSGWSGDCALNAPYAESNSACSHSDDGDDSPTSTWLVGKILTGYSSCESQQDPANGVWVQCGHSMQPSSPPYYNPTLGAWQTKVTASATHALCGTQSSSSPISQTWQSSGGTTLSSSNAPPGPPTPYNTSNPPRVCGGGSCYDPNSDQYCATANGQQVCVLGPTARSGAGGCSASAGGTLCAGSPSSPSPPSGSVPDPATDIRSVDKTQQADSATGSPIQVTTTVYAVGDTQTASGQQSSDSGPSNGGQSTRGNDPAHASSAGGNGTYQGGTDCNTPPVCTGDAVLCGASRAQWSTTCQVHKDLAGTSPAPSASTLGSSGAYDQGSLWVTPAAGNTVGDQANAGNYDQTGFGYSVQCPMKDLTVPLGSYSFAVPFSEGCVIGPWLRAIVIAFALYAGAKITAGGVG